MFAVKFWRHGPVVVRTTFAFIIVAAAAGEDAPLVGSGELRDSTGDTAWLVLDSPAAAGDDVTVSYLGSAMHPLADASGRLRPGPWDGLAAENLTDNEQPALDLRLEGTRVVVAPEVCIASGPDVTEGDDAAFSLTAEPALAVAITVEIELKVLGDYAPRLTADSATLVQVQIPTDGRRLYTVATVDDDTEEPDGFIVASLVAGHGYDVCEENVAAVSVTDNDSLQSQIQARINETATSRASAANLKWRRGLAAVRGEDPPAGAKPMTARIARKLADRASGAGKAEAAALWERIADAIGNRASTPPPSEVNIAGGSDITEGGSAVFTLTASPAPASDLAVNVSVSESGDFGAATGSRTVTISTGGTATLSIATVGDNVDEPDGAITATLGTGSGYTVSSTAGVATVGVADDDDPPRPEIGIAGGTDITEGGSVVFTLTASPAPASDLTVNVSVSQSGDFGAATGSRTATISTGGTATLSIATVGDNVDEPDGAITATLGTGSGYTVSSTAGVATVAVADDDDPPRPEISIAGGGDITEGDSAGFTLVASPAPASALTVNVSVSQSGDFGVTTGSRTVTISGPGTPCFFSTAACWRFTIATTDDEIDEPRGVVTATLGSGSGYTVSTSFSSATVGVADDDLPLPSWCVGADLHDRVRGYYASPPSKAAKARWAAVLQAFGYDMGVTAMTAAEAQAYHDRGPAWREKWAGIPEAIRCLENAAVSAVVNGPVVTLTWEASRDGFGSPSGSDYGVRVNGVPRAVVSADLSGDTAWLVLDSPAAAGDDVTVSYLGSAMHPLADASGRLRPGPWDGLAAENLTDNEQPALPAMVVDGRPADPFAAADIDTSTLDASGLGLTGLGGVARLVALERLDLSDNAMSDLSPLAGLGNLRELDLSGNGAVDLWPLAGLHRLERLDLSDNAMADLSPLAGLGNLRELDLSGNGAVDLWPLAGLHRLERLDLSDNAVTDVQALAGLSGLKVLLLDGNAVADVWPLAGLGRLESLGLSGNRIGEVAALQDLARLRRLDLSGNPLGDLSPLGDVGSLVWLALPGETPGDSVTLGRLARLRWVWPGTVRLPSMLEVEAPR